MALTLASLVKIAGADQALWVYGTNDTATQVAAANYFNGATTLLNQYDTLMIHTDKDGTLGLTVAVVTSASRAAAVTIAVNALTLT